MTEPLPAGTDRSPAVPATRWTALAAALAGVLVALAVPFVAGQPDAATRFPQDRWLGGDGARTVTIVDGDLQQARERAEGTLAQVAGVVPAEVLVAIEEEYGFDPDLPVARDLLVSVDATGGTLASGSVFVRTAQGDRQIAEYSHQPERTGTFVLTFDPPLLTFPALAWDRDHPEQLTGSIAEAGTYTEAGAVPGLGTYEHEVVHAVDDAAAGCVSATRTLRVHLADGTLAGEIVTVDGWCADGTMPDLGAGQERTTTLLHPSAAATAPPLGPLPDAAAFARLVAGAPPATARRDAPTGDGAMLAVGGVYVRSALLAGDLVARWPEGTVAWMAHPGGRITTTATDGRLLAAATATPALAVYDATGTRQWAGELDDLAAAVAVAGPRVYAATLDGRIAAYDAANGRRLWSVRPADTPLAIAPIGDRWLAVADASGAVAVYDAARGARRWEASVPGVARVAATGTRVFASTGVDVVAFDADGGGELWSARAAGEQLALAGDVVWSVGGRRGVAIDAASGAVLARTGGADQILPRPDGHVLAMTETELRTIRADGAGAPIGDLCPGVALAAAGPEVVGWCRDGSWISTASAASTDEAP